MGGLILKDIFVLKKTLSVYAVLFAVYGYMAVVENQWGLMLAMIFIISVNLPITALAYDERSRWDRIANTMPITRKEVVLARYMLAALLSAVSSLLVQLVMLFNTEIFWAERVAYLIIMLLLSAFYQALLIPLVIKFGSEKSRIILVTATFAPILILLLLSKLPFFNVDEITVFLTANMNKLPYITVAAVVIIYIASVLLSVKIYENKDL